MFVIPGALSCHDWTLTPMKPSKGVSEFAKQIFVNETWIICKFWPEVWDSVDWGTSHAMRRADLMKIQAWLDLKVKVWRPPDPGRGRGWLEHPKVKLPHTGDIGPLDRFGQNQQYHFFAHWSAVEVPWKCHWSGIEVALKFWWSVIEVQTANSRQPQPHTSPHYPHDQVPKINNIN